MYRTYQINFPPHDSSEEEHLIFAENALIGDLQVIGFGPEMAKQLFFEFNNHPKYKDQMREMLIKQIAHQKDMALKQRLHEIRCNKFNVVFAVLTLMGMLLVASYLIWESFR